MRRNCNPELCVFTSADSHKHRYFRQQPMMVDMNESPQERQEEEEEEQQQQKQLTIFYNGKVFVSDVAELQARAILLLASREMEDKLRSPTGSEAASSSILLPSQLYSPVGLPMRRSLQSFLQKRKHRIQATSPYNISHCMKNRRLRKCGRNQ